MTSAPLFMLNNGVQMPRIGLGFFQTPPGETTSAVEAAVSIGYRHIDTAAAYSNEREAGEGIRRSGLDHSQVFIETKVWISDYGYDETLHAFDKSAAKVGVDYIDLLILHQPLSTAFELTVQAYEALEHDSRMVCAVAAAPFEKPLVSVRCLQRRTWGRCCSVSTGVA